MPQLTSLQVDPPEKEREAALFLYPLSQELEKGGLQGAETDVHAWGLDTRSQQLHQPMKAVFGNLGNCPSDLQTHTARMKLRKRFRLWSPAEPVLASPS